MPALDSMQGKLKRGFSGLLVIVGGVLLALAADAGWEERGDRIREQEVLRDLLQEFQENELRLLDDMEANRLASHAARVWGAAMLGDTPIPPDSIRTLFSAMQQGVRFDPITGAIRSLLDSGDLPLVQSDDLRRALAGWPDRAAEALLSHASIDDRQRIPILTMLLMRDSGGSWSPSERGALDFVVANTGWNGHLEALLDRIREIIRLIERDIKP